MKVKLSVREYWKWVEETFTPIADMWVEDEKLTIDGKEIDADDLTQEALDDAIVTVHGGVIYSADDDSPAKPIVPEIKRWLKKQSTAVIAFEIDKSKVDDLVSVAKKLGAKRL